MIPILAFLSQADRRGGRPVSKTFVAAVLFAMVPFVRHPSKDSAADSVAVIAAALAGGMYRDRRRSDPDTNEHPAAHLNRS